MKESIRKLFAIYPGEEKAATQLTLLGFLWALAISSALKFSDPLFLKYVGADSLPFVYGVSSSALIILAAFLLYAFHHFEQYLVFLGVIASALTIYAFFLCCLLTGWGMESGVLWFALKIVGMLFSMVFITCYWTFIDQYYSLQDAKRLFSLFSSAIFFGVATTGLAMQSGWFEMWQVLCLVLLFLAAAGVWVWQLHCKLTPVHDENSLQGSASQGDLPWHKMVQMVFSSPFTLVLMAHGFFIYVNLVNAEFSYLAALQKAFPEQSALTSFFGSCLVGVGIANLLIGLFVYSRLVLRFGMRGVLPITGLLLTLDFAGWLTYDSLAFAVMALFFTEGTIYVIDDSNFNLLLNGVSPRLKYRVRIFIESFLYPSGMLLGAGLLGLFPESNKLMGLLLGATTLMTALLLSYYYGGAIYRNLKENGIRFHLTLEQWLLPEAMSERRQIQRTLLQQLHAEESSVRLMAAEGLLAYEDLSLIRALFHAADSWEKNDKDRLLKLLTLHPLAQENEIIQALERWYEEEDGDTPLANRILFHLAKAGLLHPEKGVDLLDHEKLILRGAAILSLQGSWAHLSAMQVTQNRILATQEEQKLLVSDNEVEVVMGLTLVGITGGAQDVDMLVPYLTDPRPVVARTAMKAMAQIATIYHFKYLNLLVQQLTRLSDSAYRLSAIAAIVQIGDTHSIYDLLEASAHLRPQERRAIENAIVPMGLRTVPLLLSLMKNTQLPDKSRILAVRILSRLALPQLRANLQAVLNVEIQRAYFYYQQSQQLTPLADADTHILRETLKTSYRQVVDFIIHLLGEAGQIDDCELLARSLTSKNPKVRSHVIETLAKSCRRETFQQLYPLVADIPQSEKLRACQRYIPPPLPIEELLNYMEKSASPLERMVSAMYKKQLNLPGWRKALQDKMTTGDEAFVNLAYELL